MGDLGVIYLDGYVEIKDRFKDVIILGGENISSLEVEGVILKNFKVVEVVVVMMFYLWWSEIFCVFIIVRKENDNKNVIEKDILVYCRSNFFYYVVFNKVVFVDELLRIIIGKVWKNVLRVIIKKF